MATRWLVGIRSPKRARYAGPWSRKMAANSTMTDLARRSEVAHECREGLPCQGVGFDREMGVDGGGGGCIVSQRGLDEAQIDTGLEHMRRIAVAQGVDRG